MAQQLDHQRPTSNSYKPYTDQLILSKGHVENLPDMNHGRYGHGCGSYYSDGTMVSVVGVVICYCNSVYGMLTIYMGIRHKGLGTYRLNACKGSFL